MPKIATKTLDQHRKWRRDQLIDTAMAIALESGGEFVTVSAVAERAGLSRTSVYEYFSSSADMAADLILKELKSFGLTLSEATNSANSSTNSIERWIQESLSYIADGRHMLARAFRSTDFPKEKVAAISAAHGALLAPLRSHLQALGIKDISMALALVQSSIDGATKSIECGDDADTVIEQTRKFCIAGLRSLI